MLRFIIGGVALAATGYGVKYLDHENELNDLEDSLVDAYASVDAADEYLCGFFGEEMQEANKLHVEIQEVIEAFEDKI